MIGLWVWACAVEGPDPLGATGGSVGEPWPTSGPSMGGQIGESSTPVTPADEGLWFVSGAAALGGGRLPDLASARIAPTPGEGPLGGHLADLGGAIAVTGAADGTTRVWVFDGDVVTAGGDTAAALAELDLGPVDPPELVAADLSGATGDPGDPHGDPGDPLGDLVVPLGLELAVFDAATSGSAPRATLVGADLGRPVAIAGGLLIPHGGADGGVALAALTGVAAGPNPVEGGGVLPDGAISVHPVGDVGGDGVADLWVQGDAVGWLIDGAAAREGRVEVASEVAADQLVDLGDLDSDGLADSALRAGARLGVLTGSSALAGGQGDRWDAWGDDLPGPIAAADLDGDGVGELLVPRGGGWSIVDPQTREERALLDQDPAWPSVVHPVADLDGDGAADLVVGRAR